jgi:hypothetical protein
MKPNKTLQRLALLIVIFGFAGLFAWLLIDTLRADAPFDPSDLQTALTPVLSGALGLVLALSLGVDTGGADTKDTTSRWRRLWDNIDAFLVLGAIVYLISGVAGAIVWGIKDEVTPALVTAIVLTIGGYLAATMTALARSG